MREIFFLSVFFVVFAGVMGFGLGSAFPKEWGLTLGEICVAVIAFFALLSAAFQAYAMFMSNVESRLANEKNLARLKLSIRPVVTCEFQRGLRSDSFGRYYLDLQLNNLGLGPAKVFDVDVFWDGVPVSFTQLFELMFKETGVYVFLASNSLDVYFLQKGISDPFWLKAGDNVTLFSFEIRGEAFVEVAHENSKQLERAFDLLACAWDERVKIFGKYSSIEDEIFCFNHAPN